MESKTQLASLFDPIALRGVTLRNRIVVSPMCMYSAKEGLASDFHLVQLGRFALGGAGLVFVEATAVSRRGRITNGDLGLWRDEQIPGLARIARFLKQHGAAAGIQIGHAGRKASTQRPWFGSGPLDSQDKKRGDTPWPVIAPSAIPIAANWPVPKQMTLRDIERIKSDFVNAGRRAIAAGFDVLELHCAHGYLLHEFLSPLSNHRTDEYGGDGEGRMKLLLEVATMVREIWPEGRPLFVRVSAVDNIDGGLILEDTVELASKLAAIGIDVVDCSSGGLLGAATDRKVRGYGYQVPYAQEVRHRAGIRTIAVGLIDRPEHAEDIIAKGRADLVAIGRGVLDDPNWPLHARIALTLDAETSPLATLPQQHSWWLSKRAAAVKGMAPWESSSCEVVSSSE